MTRRDMEGALKLHCVPYLRNLGFKGSFPDLYREENGLLSLLNFQFYSSGGSLCVNISYSGRNGENIYFRKDAEPRHVRLAHTRVRARLDAENLIGDKWFCFAATDAGELRGVLQSPRDIAMQINQLINDVALPWWSSKAEAPTSAADGGPGSTQLDGNEQV